MMLGKRGSKMRDVFTKTDASVKMAAPSRAFEPE